MTSVLSNKINLFQSTFSFPEEEGKTKEKRGDDIQKCKNYSRLPLSGKMSEALFACLLLNSI